MKILITVWFYCTPSRLVEMKMTIALRGPRTTRNVTHWGQTCTPARLLRSTAKQHISYSMSVCRKLGMSVYSKRHTNKCISLHFSRDSGSVNNLSVHRQDSRWHMSLWYFRMCTLANGHGNANQPLGATCGWVSSTEYRVKDMRLKVCVMWTMCDKSQTQENLSMTLDDGITTLLWRRKRRGRDLRLWWHAVPWSGLWAHSCITRSA